MAFNSAELQKALTLSANILAQEIRASTPNPDYPKELASSIEVGTATIDGNGIGKIGIYGGTLAFVYEEGSGIHGIRGSTYPITPKNSTLLAFGPEKWSGNIPGGVSNPVKKYVGRGKRDGNLLFLYVDHPGVEAKPYLEDALARVSDQILEIIGTAIIVSFVTALGPKVEIIR